MMLQIESTDKIITVDGVACRCWKGVTASGVACEVLVHRIAVDDQQDTIQFELELRELAMPSGLACDLNESDAQRIGELICTQDNRCTSDPLFIVQQRHRIYGLDKDHTEDHLWWDAVNNEEATDEEAAGLYAIDDDGGDVGAWVRIGYIDRWEFVTACFTERGCQDYIDAHGHNLTAPRIYAASAYRNAEFIAVRKLLASFGSQK